MNEITAENMAEESENTDPMFYGVGRKKFIVMSILTWGLYEFYWFYKNFSRYESRYDEGSIPFLRALFSPLFSFLLFSSVNAELESRESEKRLPATVLGLSYLALNIAARYAPGLYGLLAAFLIFTPLLAVNDRINTLNKEDSDSDPDSKFTWINWIFIVLGSVFTLLVVAGAMLPQNA